MLGRSTSLLTGVAVLLLATPVAAHASAPGARTAPPVTITSAPAPFSPNADGVQDRGRVDFRMPRGTSVTARVTSGRRTVLVRSLGHLSRGAHAFVWDGRAARARGGRVVPDGAYTVSLVTRATSSAHPVTARTPLIVSAHPAPLGLASTSDLSSAVVYPRTTVEHDAVVGALSTAAAVGDASTVRRQAVDAGGRVVDSDPLEKPCTGCAQRWTWDGRGTTGTPVPAGRYAVRFVQGRDRAGNPRVLAAPVPVTVSDQRLVARTTTFTADAGDLTRRSPCDGPTAAQDCGSLISAPRGSERFPGGRSYRSEATSFAGSTFDTVAWDYYLVPVTGRVTPQDTFSVTVRGGPTTAGAADHGALRAGEGRLLTGTGNPAPVLVQGEEPVRLAGIHYLGMADPLAAWGGLEGPVLEWSFSTGNRNAYDVATFEVARTSYVLP